jgi:hypothetical protein
MLYNGLYKTVVKMKGLSGKCVVFGVAFFISLSFASGQTNITEQCSVTETVGILLTDVQYLKPLSELARVEIIRCGPDDKLLIKAWEQDATKPALLIDTSDFSIVQTFARDNVFVVVTSGGSRDQVYVITYRNGKPTLALKQVTKGGMNLSVDRHVVRIIIDGIYAGDEPPRSETHDFRLK